MSKWKKAIALTLLGLCIFQVSLPGIGDVLLIQAEAAKMPLRDIETSFAKSAIMDLYARGIVKGNGGGFYEPKRTMTRAEGLAAMLRLLKLSSVPDGVSVFRDTPKNAWYYGEVQAGAYLGLAQGKGDGTYKPGDGVTRQELAVWLVRFLRQAAVPGYLNRIFSDAGQIAGWAEASVYTVQRMGLMEGDGGRFRPEGVVTREEMAAVLERIISNSRWEKTINKADPEVIQMGWQYGQTTAQFKASVSGSAVNVLAPRWFFTDDKGSVASVVDTSLVTFAHSSGRKVWALVGNRSNMEATHSMLSTSSYARKAASALASYAKQYSLDGINLDFENVAPEDRAALTSFVADLAAKLHQNGDVLSVCVSPDLGSDWTAAFDYAALGASADNLVLMGYDEHWSTDPVPGPVGSLSWVASGLQKLLKVVDPETIILALPLYSRDWTLQPDGSTLSSEDIDLKVQRTRISRYGLWMSWNSTLGQYKTSYVRNGKTHNIWIEDARSLTAKLRMAENKGIAGFAYWSIGEETPEVWTALQNALRFDSYSF